MAEEDLIFGKNRHFFGGIEPSNMVKFTAEMQETSVLIDAQLPKDTVIDGQTLCTVAGAVIRRKTTDYPKDEFDGDLVTTLNDSSVFSDNSIIPNGTYYYSAFPFTTQGVYNRNKANRVVVNEPPAMVKFTATSKYDSAQKKLTVIIDATLPEGVAGAKIRRSITNFPLNENDGMEFKNITSSGQYIDEDVSEGTTYYYSAFPYTSTGAFNRDESNRASVAPKSRGYYFGFDLDMNDPNPDTRVTYPSDVDNYGFSPAYMNFETGKFDYGGWNMAPGEKFMPRPCMLRKDGTVKYYLDPNNYKKKENGIDDSEVVSGESEDGIHAMMEWPCIYTKREQVGNIYKFRCSSDKLDENYDCWCNYNAKDEVIAHFYTSIYPTVSNGMGMASLSGKQINRYPGSTSIYDQDNMWKTVKDNLGEGWYVEPIADRFLIQDLAVLITKSTNSDKTLGIGYRAAKAGSYMTTGSLDTKGLFYGSSTAGVSHVKIFGMECFYDFIYPRMLSGTNTPSKIKITPGRHDGSTIVDFQNDQNSGNNYISLESGNQMDMQTHYVKNFAVKPYGRYPTNVQENGSSTTYECSFFQGNTSNCNLFGGLPYTSDSIYDPFEPATNDKGGLFSYHTDVSLFKTYQNRDSVCTCALAYKGGALK